MPPTQSSADPQEGNNKKGSIDLDKILLPKKDAHAPETAERVNAGVLLQQEEHASLRPKQGAEEEKSGRPEDGEPRTFLKQPPAEASAVTPLQTYQGDIEKLVQKKNIGVVQIAAAEASKQAEVVAEEPAPVEEQQGIGKNILMITGGVLLILAGIGGIAYVLVRPTPTAQVLGNPQAPFIEVDATTLVAITGEDRTRAVIMNKLESARQSTTISLGLINRLYPAAPSATADAAPTPINVQTILTALSTNIPNDFVRSIDPYYYTLGVHSFDENQALLIFKVDAYSSAYAGMLAWERTMYADLQPLFNRTPRPRIIGKESTTTEPVPQVLATAFIDRVVENRDSRVVQNKAGDILLLWTFLDRYTIAITTDEHTLRELITRLQEISIVPEF